MPQTELEPLTELTAAIELCDCDIELAQPAFLFE